MKAGTNLTSSKTASSRGSREVAYELHLRHQILKTSVGPKLEPSMKSRNTMKLRRIVSFAILVGILLLTVIAYAQSPSPTPAPSPVRSLSDNIAALSHRAGSLIPYINNEIVSELIAWFEPLAGEFRHCLAGF